MQISVVKPHNNPTDCLVFTTSSHGGATFSRYDPKSAKYYSALTETYNLHKLVTLHQNHTATVAHATLGNYLSVDGASADGLFTTSRGLALGIRTVGGIISNGMKFFDKVNDRPTYAYVGAGICQKNFEVKIDFIQKASSLIQIQNYLMEDAGRFYFDLKQLILDQLATFGVDTIECANVCTYESADYYSHRQSTSAGRMITVARRNLLV
jgi:copper oxidase (laccase) domain-containing protein